MLSGGGVAGAGPSAQTDDQAPTRPAISFNRWQEDWSVLANPDVPKEPFDNLKYISLSDQDPRTYLSLGSDLRERFESNDATNFGVSNAEILLKSRVNLDASRTTFVREYWLELHVHERRLSGLVEVLIRHHRVMPIQDLAARLRIDLVSGRGWGRGRG